MIIITGGAGFIGSSLVWKLNEKGLTDILVVDRLGKGQKWQNLAKRQIRNIIHKDLFLGWLKSKPRSCPIEAIFHMGACSSTTEPDADYLLENNIHYSMELFEYAAREKIPFIYASSAATYGAGEHGFSDQPNLVAKLRPINAYGYSKQFFDCWAARQKDKPPFWVGLKFFNVYGPNEYHKGGQASVAYHAFPQVKDDKVLKLFKSYREKIAHGEQKRDFIYVKDVVDVMYHLLQASDVAVSGIYNLGTGRARTFADLGIAVFRALGQRKEKFQWVDMPENLKNQYQYFTEANMDLLRQRTGYTKKFTSLEDGVLDYVRHHLMTHDPYL